LDTSAPSQVSLYEFVAIADLFGGALKKSAALDQNVNAIAHVKDQAHIVVDELNAKPAVSKMANVLGKFPDFTLIQTCCWLVKKYVVWRSGESARYSRASFDAVRQRTRGMIFATAKVVFVE
jgi:hypothetical protein